MSWRRLVAAERRSGLRVKVFSEVVIVVSISRTFSASCGVSRVDAELPGLADVILFTPEKELFMTVFFSVGLACTGTKLMSLS
jgi:hypothetical protein